MLPGQGGQGVGGVARPAGLDLQTPGRESRDVGDRRLDHRQPVGRRGDRPFSLLLPRDVGDHQDQRVQGEGVAHVDGGDQVTDVGRVEGPAEQSDAQRRRGVRAGGWTSWRTR